MMGLIYDADLKLIAGIIADEDRRAIEAYRPSVSARECELMAEAGRLRESVRYLDALAERQAKMIGAQRDELRTLKGENAQPLRGSKIATVICADAYVQIEYDYTPAEDAVMDVESTGCGPGHAEEIEPLRAFINGQWCDLSDVQSALADDALVEAIGESLA